MLKIYEELKHYENEIGLAVENGKADHKDFVVVSLADSMVWNNTAPFPTSTHLTQFFQMCLNEMLDSNDNVVDYTYSASAIQIYL